VTSERWQRIEALFEQTLEAPAAERPEFLRAIDDAELRREVESLLHSHGQAGPFLDEPNQFFTSQSFEVDTLSPGQIIDRYRVIREIGRGGMGAVFLAERADDEYQKQVAVKLIKRGTDTDTVLRHFRNERQILAGFDHPNIARLLDGGTTNSGLPYFVMEYVDGLPIDEYCNAHALSVVERLKLFREVCAAVSYAHRHLVIHRDIKRSNILITAEGVPKLLDFGIAKILKHGDEPLATMTGMRLMTPESASPEQIRGQPVTTASDVYSLGLVLYELLCGCSPYQFTSQSQPEMARVIIETEPKRPSTAIARGIDNSKFGIRNSKLLKGDLDTIVLMALRKEPERRYQSVEQLSEDIRRHLEERPVLARKDTMGYRAVKFARRNKTALAAAGIVLFILVGGIIATNRQAHIAMREKARAERRFNDVRKLANNVLFDYHDAIKDLPGATKVRERLVKDALNYLDSLAGEAHGDAELQRELASAYERVGDVRGGNVSGSLGDPVGALESYRKAFGICEGLIAANRGDAQARRALARNHQKIGTLLLRTDDPGKGVEHLQAARTLCLDLTGEQPADDDLQFELATVCRHLGSAMGFHNDYPAGLAQLRAALAILEKIVAKNPQNQAYRRGLWTTHEKAGWALWMQGDATGAIEANIKARELGEALLAEDPLNADYSRGLVANYQNGGNYRMRSDRRTAVTYLLKAAALDEKLLVADPNNALTLRDLGSTHHMTAELLEALEDYAQALPHFRKALECYEKLVSGAPDDLYARFMVVSCHAGAAQMQARLGEIDPAREECRKAVALLKEISAGKPGHLGRAQACAEIGSAYHALAEAPKVSTAETRQHMNDARDMLQQALNILDDARRLKGGLGANEEWAKEIAGELAKCDAALGK